MNKPNIDAPDRVLPRWRFFIDRGGTFTDIVAQHPDGRLSTHKVLSVDPNNAVDPTLRGIASILGLEKGAPIPRDSIELIRFGTTIATNALLERRGSPTVFVTTRGFGDVLRIGYQTRPDIFAQQILLPEPLYTEVIEAEERLAADGVVLAALNTAAMTDALRACRARGVRSCAIALLNSYRNGEHERAIAEIARQLGFEQVSMSHELGALAGFIARGDTAVVDAYVTPPLQTYVRALADEAAAERIFCMKSDGGLSPLRALRGKDAILSGPAGGVTACVRTAQQAGFDRAVGFDMGGTSSDVCHFAGEFERSYDSTLAGIRFRTPMLRVHTIAAGGGSIVRFAAGRLQVGPESAGANPGPACYGRGGPLTITDCNVLLGRLTPDAFAAVFGPNGKSAIDPAATQQRFAELAQQMAAATGEPWAAERIAEGALQIAIEAMARAIAKITTERGYDVRDHVLNCFGGAAGQHACRVAEALGMQTIMVHPFAGALSAYGMALAEVTARREATLDLPLSEYSLQAALDVVAQLAAQAKAELQQQRSGTGDMVLSTEFHLRYRDAGTSHLVRPASLQQIIEAFEAAHRRHYGFISRDREVVIERVAVEQRTSSRVLNDPQEATVIQAATARQPALDRHTSVYFDGAWQRTPRLDRAELHCEKTFRGPGVINDPMSTIIVEPGWSASADSHANLILRRVAEMARPPLGVQRDAVRLELFDNLFMSIAEQMGAVLQNSAVSTNIKERLDFSCAIFDHTGALIANAPHMPVHLGSMGASVAVVVEQAATLQPGDVFMLNDPYRGGTHLPDITVVTPVFCDDMARPFCYVASRAHHADIGGITPGSMPADSHHIDEEGVLIPLLQIVDAARGFHSKEIRQVLLGARYPVRNFDNNLADLRAQVAANEKGAAELRQVVSKNGSDVVRAYMGHVQDLAEELTRAAIAKLHNGRFAVEMDEGGVIQVAINVDRSRGQATIDFTGTSAQRASNFNAPASIARAAVLYVFRCLIKQAIALNEGMARPLKIILPPRTMLSPEYPAAVVAGNVEVSQAIVDALNGALGTMAASQGTMNNLTFGNERYQYYETICGGAGAGPGFDGASAVHTHMTNSRMTDPEILESRLPVRLLEFAIRRGSMGMGRWRGGDGARRRLQFLESMTVSLLANRHRTVPFGLAGGLDARPGRAWIDRANGESELLNATSTVAVGTGDVLTIETPGGGGFG